MKSWISILSNMDFGIAGNMRMSVAEPQERHDSVAETRKKGENDDSQIEMLELEIEDLTLELEKEKEVSTKERAENEKHVLELQQARTGISCFQQLLKERDAQMKGIQDELTYKSKLLVDADKELARSRQRIEELASEREERQVEATRDTTRPKNPFIASEEIIERPDSGLENETLTAELQACQRELANKTKEMDTLRSYLRAVEPRKAEKRRPVIEDESEMAKQMKIKDAMISRYTAQIEELQAKTRRIPQFSAQAAKSEVSITTLKSQRSALNEKLKEKTKLFEQKERIMNEHVAKLEATLTSVESQALSAKSSFERDLHSMNVAKEGLEKEIKARREHIANLMSEVATTKQDYDNGVKALQFEMEKRLKEQVAKTHKVEKSLKSERRALSLFKDENKRLRQHVSELELDPYVAHPIRPNRSATVGIVFCVDLSSSVYGVPETLVKNAFKQLLNHLHTVYPETHVGIVVQTTSIYVVREVSPVWSADVAVLDSILAGGSENYTRAFALVSVLFEKFQTANPGAKRRVIMISDGEGGSISEDVTALGANEVPCHNLVVDKGGSSAETCSTAVYSSDTGGRNILCSNMTAADMELILAP
jgi:myosin heavy subunit